MEIRKVCFLLGLSLFSLSGFCQNEVTLVNFTPSQCDESEDPYRIQTRIVNQWYQGDTLLVEVGTVGTCCVDFVPSVQFSTDTLNLDFTETGTFCSCHCCYQFIYHIVGLKGKRFGITLNGEKIEQSEEKYKTFPVKYELYNGDTINYFDKYGFKQGLHILGKDKQKPLEKMIYHDNHAIEGSRWIRYFDNGNKSAETLVKNKRKLNVQYYMNERKKKECEDLKIAFTTNNLWKYVTRCNAWDSMGIQVSTMDCCLMTDTSEYSLILTAFKGKFNRKVYINYSYAIKEEELKKIMDIGINPNDKVLFCSQKGMNGEFRRKVIQTLRNAGSILLEISEFEQYE
ncbi:MAG: hypothetical protein JKX84_08920 [Flavobacteriales bacterium]|nr:hypothetical protein [Flavobacteriales bacterium]